MTTQTTMLHVRVDDQVKKKAAENLQALGLTLSDAVRILLTRIAQEGGVPPGLVVDHANYDIWFKSKVLEAINDKSSTVPHNQVMDDIQDLIDKKR